MQHSKETTPKSVTQSGVRFANKSYSGVCKNQFLQTFSINYKILSLKLIEVVRVNRIHTCIHHWFGGFETWLRFDFFLYFIKSISYPGFLYFFHIRKNIADLTWTELVLRNEFRLQDTKIKYLVTFVGMAGDDGCSFLQGPIHNIEQADNIFAIHKPTVNQKQFEFVLLFSHWGIGHFFNNPLQKFLNIFSRFR